MQRQPEQPWPGMQELRVAGTLSKVTVRLLAEHSQSPSLTFDAGVAAEQTFLYTRGVSPVLAGPFLIDV
ncbi:hypothetical protein SRHO_G00096610 [Serrasalmus rhombeus]